MYSESKKHSIASAISVIQTAARFGLEGLRAFTLTRELPHILEEDFDETEETYDEFIERLSTACWMSSAYFIMWLGDENVSLDWHELQDMNLDNLSDGVYYMAFEGSESHFWVWIIDGPNIWYAGTYGGVCDIVVKVFNRAHYNKRFIRAMNGSLDDYAYIFQVEPAVEDVGYGTIEYRKSNRY